MRDYVESWDEKSGIAIQLGNEEFFRVRNIMDRLLGDLESGYDLSVSVDRDRGFQESFSGFSGSPGII